MECMREKKMRMNQAKQFLPLQWNVMDEKPSQKWNDRKNDHSSIEERREMLYFHRRSWTSEKKPVEKLCVSQCSSSETAPKRPVQTLRSNGIGSVAAFWFYSSDNFPIGVQCQLNYSTKPEKEQKKKNRLRLFAVFVVYYGRMYLKREWAMWIQRIIL